MAEDDCVFCDVANPELNSIEIENDLAYVRWDRFPVSKGHVEIVPRRHVVSFFELTDAELIATNDLLKLIRRLIDDKYHPDAYNIGVNDGTAAGRTIHHCHIHLIPRYMGDVDDPRGGIRHVIPGKGNY